MRGLFFCGSLLSIPVALSAQISVQELAQDWADEAPAAVIYLRTPDGVETAATGRFEAGGRATQTDDAFILASVSKTYLAAAILQLQDQGVLNICDPVTRWVPRKTATLFGGLDGITIAHLLSMRSGLPDYYTDDFVLATAGENPPWSVPEALRFARGEPRLFAPGQAFNYSNTNYLLAQQVYEAACGGPMHTCFAAQLFEPLGLNDTHVFGHERNGAVFVHGYENADGIVPVDVTAYYQNGVGFGDGSLFATADNIARFYEALFVDGAVLRPETLTLMMRGAADANYGLGLALGYADGLGQVVGHGGADIGFSSDVVYAPDLQAIAIILIADSVRDPEFTVDLLLEYAERIE